MPRVVATELPDVLIIEPEVYRDNRGFFLETYHAAKYAALGIARPFVQDNHSSSRTGTLRGLHLQRRNPQAKLVRVVRGEIFDVAVDARRGSPTFGRYVTAVLSADNLREYYVPAGFAHGFYATDGPAEVEYKCTTFYDPASEVGIIWNDPDLAIPWPTADPILSPKDAALRRFAEVADLLPTLEECRAATDLVQRP
jgi:dTDP-4-dehydrorhamnose 3,5-epimerase